MLKEKTFIFDTSTEKGILKAEKKQAELYEKYRYVTTDIPEYISGNITGPKPCKVRIVVKEKDKK